MRKKKGGISGTFKPRIREEGPTYPWGMDDVPRGYTVGDADAAAMTAAGFPREAGGASSFVDRNTGRKIDMADIRYYVLRDSEGAIVATWDEGRWWTPYESARLTQEYVRAYS